MALSKKHSKSKGDKLAKVVKQAIAKTSKTQKVQEHLIANKTITSWQAIKEYGSTRLAAIIFVLRERGWIIDSKDVSFEDRYGNVGTYAQYTLISSPKNKAKK